MYVGQEYAFGTNCPKISEGYTARKSSRATARKRI